MTAIRNFPDAPLAQRRNAPPHWQVPALAQALWQGLHRFGRRRAAWELEVAADRQTPADPALSRSLRSAAAECRRAADADRT